MMKVKVYILLLSVLLNGNECVPERTKGSAATFRGAVYEHAIKDVILNTPNPTRPEVMKALSVNTVPLAKAVVDAKSQEADIIVFPEYAITGFRWYSRSHIRPVLENYPGIGVNPCKTSPNDSIQKWLSCLARDNKIYIVANVGDLKPCDDKEDFECPDSGAYQYNTNVVFDRNGTILHRYHKINLFGFEVIYMDYGKYGQKNLVFETELGRMSSMICFDIVFDEPGVPITNANQIDTMLFTTAWMNRFPEFVSVQYHSSWSLRHNVNVLAAETHRPQIKMTGSGLYTPTGVINYTFDMETENPKLLVADLPIKPKRQKFQPAKHVEEEWADYEFKNEYYNFVELSGSSGKVRVCKGNICCKAEYEYSKGGNGKEFYALGASYELPYHRNGSIEICVVIKCLKNKSAGCGDFVTDTTSSFKSLAVSGNFSSDQVHPSASLDGLKMAEEGEFDTTTIGKIGTKASDLPIVTMVLLGRNYQATVPIPSAASPQNVNFSIISWLLDFIM